MTAGAGRGRPRSARADAAIVEAVLRLLEEGVPAGELSMERVARTAGVGKATVYRRWPNRDALLLDVMRALDEPLPEPAGVSVRDDLVALLEFLRRRGTGRRSGALMRGMLARFQSQPRLWDAYQETVIRSRREALCAVLRRGMATGEIRSDAEPALLADLFAGPVLMSALLQEGEPAGAAARPEHVVDLLLEGVRGQTRDARAPDRI